MILLNKPIINRYKTMETMKTAEKKFEKEPDMILMCTRHAERLAGGEATEEGLEKSKRIGKSLGEIGLYKPYPSFEKRAQKTGEAIADGTGTKSPLTEKMYRSHRVRDIEYGFLKREYPEQFKKAKFLIEEATLREMGLPVELDDNGKIKMTTDMYSKEEQARMAPARQKNQVVGIKYLLEQPEIDHEMAFVIAHQLVERMKVSGEYMDYRDRSREEETKTSVELLAGPVVPGIVGHGAFFESFLKRAGVIRKENGQEEPIDPVGDEFGGIINPNESFQLIIQDRDNIPDRIPVNFLGKGRPKAGTVFIDTKKLFELDEDYRKWTQTPEYQKALEKEIKKDKERAAEIQAR